MDIIYKRTEIELATRNTYVKEILRKAGHTVSDITAVEWRTGFIKLWDEADVEIFIDIYDLMENSKAGAEQKVQLYAGYMKSWYKINNLKKQAE